MPGRGVRALSIVLTVAALLAAATVFAQTKMLRFPDIHGNTVVFSLCRRPLDRAGRRRDRDAPDRPPGARDVRPLLARREVDRLHRPVRRRRAGLRHAGRRAASRASSPTTRRAGRSRRAAATTTWSTAGRPDGKAVLFRSMRDADGDPERGQPLQRARRGRRRDEAADAHRGRRRLLARRLEARLLARSTATSAPGSATRAAGRRTSTSTTSRPTRPSLIAPSVRTERDPMWIGDTIYFALRPRRHAQPLQLRPRVEGRRAAHPRRHLGRPLGELRQRPARSSTSATASCTSTTPRPARDRRRRDHRPRRRRRPAGRRATRSTSSSRTSALSPKGERALFVARGDVFTAPIEHGPTRNLTNSSSSHEKWARWSPDGKTDRLRLRPHRRGPGVARRPGRLRQAGAAHPGHVGMMYAAEWSPDGARLAFSDKDGKLFVVTVADKKLVEVADDARGEIHDYAWAPDGAWLAFSLAEPNDTRSLWIWGVADGTLHRVTDELFNEASPVWSTRRQVPLLPLRPAVRAADLGRVELRDHPHHRHLRPRPAARTVRARSRRRATRSPPTRRRTRRRRTTRRPSPRTARARTRRPRRRSRRRSR